MTWLWVALGLVLAVATVWARYTIRSTRVRPTPPPQTLGGLFHQLGQTHEEDPKP